MVGLTGEQLSSTLAQGTYWIEHEVRVSADRAADNIVAADLDGDGDQDILSSLSQGGTIAWHENTDSNGTFGRPQRISEATSGSGAAVVADIDGDGDLDVLSVSQSESRITWYENTDGQGSFGPRRIIDTVPDFVVSVLGADIDGDHDVDVLAGTAFLGRVVWYDNTDGTGNFGPLQVITTMARNAQSVGAADLDGDDDLDVLIAAQLDSSLAWHENTDGAKRFGPGQTIDGDLMSPNSVHASDIDGDGDFDVLAVSGPGTDDQVVWYENANGSGTFAPRRVISTAVQAVQSAIPADIDGDGDLDVISVSVRDNKTAWYENVDGKGKFGPQRVISKAVRAPQDVFAADLDGDQDVDILVTGQDETYRGKAIWYETVHRPLLAGDANRDGVFDQKDIVQVLQTAKFRTGEPATWDEDDWTGNGVFDPLDIVAALQTGSYLRASHAAERDGTSSLGKDFVSDPVATHVDAWFAIGGGMDEC
jgi:hypothetical protein